MDSDIQTRLKDASQNCLEAYMSWNDKKQDSKTQEELHAAIHELRKVSSRLEIELAVSERDQLTSTHIPIPSHRSNMRGESVAILESGVDNNDDSSSVVVHNKPRRRRPPIKKLSSD